MRIYFDTALLVKAYVEEETSPLADALLRDATVPVAFTGLHGLEIRTALRLKLFRGELSAAELAGALQTLQSDLEAGLLSNPGLNLEAMFNLAEGLSAKYAAETGARSLDILHVAAAVELDVDAFASFDERQRAMARKAGLKLLPAKGNERDRK